MIHIIPSSRYLLAAFSLVLLISFSHAENTVAINSVDGRDVLSGIFYANVKGYPVYFMPVPGGNAEIFATKVGAGRSVLLIQSSSNPVSGFVETELKARGNTVEIYSSSGATTNLDLARRSGASSFIVVDSAYSDGAVSVIPLAALTKSYVLLADRTNIAQIREIVRGKRVVAFGYLDPQVKAGLSEFNPAYIGKGDDKYEDNLELVGRLMEEYSLNRPIMTDGSVLEDSIAAGNTPILLSGRLVPQQTYDFIKRKVAGGEMAGIMLIGDELVYPAYNLRERMKRDFAAEGVNATLSVMIKFAQAVPSAQTGVLALDTFRLPAYKPKLQITEIVYNQQGKKLMVGLENTGEGPLYYTIEARVGVDGREYRVFGAQDVRLIDRGESEGLEYDLDLSGVDEGAVTASVLVKYGSYSKSLEEFASSEGKLASISYSDETNVSVKGARYDKGKQLLLVTIKNNGNTPAFVFSKLTLIDEDGQQVKVGSAAIREIEPSSLYVEEFPLIMSDRELELNREITVTVDYGGRRGFLVKTSTYVVPMGEPEAAAAMEISPIILGGLAAIVVLAALFVLLKALRRKGGPGRKAGG